jgi:hypothetical protein
VRNRECSRDRDAKQPSREVPRYRTQRPKTSKRKTSSGLSSTVRVQRLALDRDAVDVDKDGGQQGCALGAVDERLVASTARLATAQGLGLTCEQVKLSMPSSSTA